MNKFLGLVIFVCATMGTISQASEPLVLIERGSDGSVRLVPSEEPEVKYESTGLQATAEAQRYPDAIRQVVTEGKTSVPVATGVAQSHMIGLLTWRVTTAATLVLAKEGNTIVTRAPATEAEKGEKTEEVTNPSGLFVLLSLLCLAIGNLVVKKKDGLAFAAFTFAFAALTFAFAAFAFAAFAFAFAFAAFAFAFAFAADNIKVYRWCSGISVACMMVAVGVAIWG